ncbi:unnamed protein product [Thlaspi arvense]|uniref:J domain-containing protein n=1 Tax=Thlaspi arvense TaxID=13288 RepID=A0AAU9SDP0_THLAR|nr:unnamed protein product [Thlaspi arvense]
MQVEEAKILLGFPPNSRPDPSQVKAAYRKKVWESHPDLFPDDQKLGAESKFKSISEAYSCLESGRDRPCLGYIRINGDDMFCAKWMNAAVIESLELLNSSSFGFTTLQIRTHLLCDVKGQRYSRAGVYSRVVKTGVPRTYAYAKRGNAWLIGAPFLLIVLGTIGLGGIKANKAYNMQKQTFPSHNPFLP